MADAELADPQSQALLTTPLHALHIRLGARMVPFAGYDMPVQYDGVMGEHNWTREHAGLFDVSHMGQAVLVGPDHATTAAALEALVPGNIAGLKPGRIRYTVLLNETGGIIDDLMVTRSPVDGHIGLVVNGARKGVDYAHIAANLPDGVTLEIAETRALIALQGPSAKDVAADLFPAANDLVFMQAAMGIDIAGVPTNIARSGYTGEDGFEISIPGDKADVVTQALLEHPEVKPIGLGARDTLRLEAGLCLYGHDIDETTSPVEANIVFATGKKRRETGGFPGFDRIAKELAEGPARKLVALRLDGRAPAREGAEIHADGQKIGVVTSGSHAPTVGGPIALGYVDAAHAGEGATLEIMVRGRALSANVCPLPFVPHRYVRG